jgi:NRPS condensation-like uncharacterized protein
MKMNNKQEIQAYKRKVTGAERFFSHAPFSTVTMVARINGLVTAEMLKIAVEKTQQRHALLRVRIKDTQDGDLWFISEGVQEIPIEVVPRKTEIDWIKVHAEGSKIPYDFENRPAIRFILVQSPAVSELIILCHHIICDGMSLAYLGRDLMVHLGDPEAAAQILAPPEPISLENIPREVVPSGLIKFFINKIKQKWAEEYVSFDQEDYEALNEAYWDNFTHEIISIELTETETAALVTRCRKEHVTVNTALITAFLGAQKYVGDEEPHHAKTAVAVSLRDRLSATPGEGMGYYALGLEVKYKYNTKKGFWENARNYQKKIGARISNKKAFGDLTSYLQMDSNIYEALSFKKLGGFVNPDSLRYKKLTDFSKREDVVVRLLQRAKIETLDAKLFGPVITNLGRMDFPKKYGNLELDRLIMQPGGAFPLVHVDMVIGAVTAVGKLSLIIEYAKEAVDTATMNNVKVKAMELLLNK